VNYSDWILDSVSALVPKAYGQLIFEG
jgi:hypothetical protein